VRPLMACSISGSHRSTGSTTRPPLRRSRIAISVPGSSGCGTTNTCISYVTVVVEIPPDATADWKLVLTLPDPPHGLFHAAMAPTEDGRWIIVIAAHSGGWWIDTWDAFLEASRLLITPTLSDALRYARPPEGIRHYRFPVSTWKHFERLPHLPRGVLPVADAFCRFNPIHAQGMSSAAKQAVLL
jgi:hypothetical protein